MTGRRQRRGALPSFTRRRAGSRIALSFLALLAGFPATPLAECLDDWQARRVAEIDTTRGTLEALFPLRLALHLQTSASDPDVLNEALGEIAGKPGTHPLLAAEIENALIRSDLFRGDLASAETRRRRLGTVEEFQLAPAGAPQNGTEGAWRAANAGPEGGLPLDAYFHPADSTSAQVVFWIESERTETVAIRFGADDGGTLEVDGVEIGTPFGNHDLRFDQHSRFVRLSRGWHRVRMVVRQESGVWGLTVRVTSADGTPLPETVRVGWPDDPATSAAALDGRGVREAGGDDALALLERAARSGKPRAVAVLATELALRGRPDRLATRALDLLHRARAAAPASRDLAWSASLIEEDAATRRAALEMLLLTRPNDAGALRRLAQHYAVHENVREAARVVDSALAACPADAALIGWHTTLTLLPGAPGVAMSRLEKLIAKTPQPALSQRLAILYAGEGRVLHARKLLETHLTRYPGDPAALEAAAGLAARAGDLERLDELAKTAARLQPHESGWTLRIVRVLLAEGRAVEALERLAPLRERNPDDPELLALDGEIRLAAGDADGAEASWRAAIARGGAPDRIEERIAALTGTVSAFGEEWAVDPATLDLAAAERAGGDSPVVILSRTNAFRVRASGLAERFVQLVLLVRRPEQALAARSHSVTYSPGLQRVSVLRARLTRRDGSLVQAVDSDRALLPDRDLRMWYDTRVVTLAFPRLEEGDVIELRYRLTDRGPVNPIADRYFGEILGLGAPVPTLASRIVIDASNSLPVHYEIEHVSGDVSETATAGEESTVTVLDLPPLAAYAEAPGAPPPSERVPYAVLGTAGSWSELGRMYAELLGDQLRLTPEMRRIVEDARRNASTRSSLIDALYAWVIENTRYVALELGIHALKPYDTATVLRRRHGDCKDKAGLLVTLLREAGIDARMALLRTRDRGRVSTTVPTFAHFDHAIVRVPDEDLWLDGTVLHHGSRELPTPDRGALALVVATEASPEGPSGKLMETPEAAPEHDAVERSEVIEPAADGGARIAIEVTARGEAAARDRTWFRSRDNPAGMLRQRLSDAHPDLILENADFPAVGLMDRVARHAYTLRLPRFGLDGASGVAFPLASELPVPPIDVPTAGREVPLDLPPPASRRTRSTFVVPVGWSVTRLPVPGELETPWGSVSLAVRRQGPDVTLVAESRFLGGRVEPGELPRLAEFLENARQLLGQRVVLEAP